MWVSGPFRISGFRDFDVQSFGFWDFNPFRISAFQNFDVQDLGFHRKFSFGNFGFKDFSFRNFDLFEISTHSEFQLFKILTFSFLDFEIFGFWDFGFKDFDFLNFGVKDFTGTASYTYTQCSITLSTCFPYFRIFNNNLSYYFNYFWRQTANEQNFKKMSTLYFLFAASLYSFYIFYWSILFFYSYFV